METQRNRVCGADIHKKFLVATILSRDGTKKTKRFGMTLDDLLDFKSWVMENQCEQVAVESTGVYWIPIHSVLENAVDLIVANAYKIKHIPGRKSDLIDSEWIAELCLNGMIEPSRIFPKDDRELRRLTRAREGYVNDMTREKNKIHHALESCGILPEDDVTRTKTVDVNSSSLPTKLGFEEMIQILTKAGYEIRKTLQAQDDSLLLLFQDSFTWEIILAAYRPEKLYIRCVQLAILWHLL
jgi:transposase